jgi:hypothetical protein
MALKKVEMTAVEMTPVFMQQIMTLPVGVRIGPQLLSNSQFEDMTIGSEVIVDPGFDNALDWSFSAGWAVAASNATHTGGTSDNIQSATNVTNIGDSYVAVLSTVSNTEDGTQRITARWADTNYTVGQTAPGVDTVYTAAVGSPTPQTPALRSAGATLGSWVCDSFSVKPISLDDYSELGTRNANEYMVFNAADDTVRIVSGGLTMGITQVIPDFVAGDYYYSVGTTAITGSLIISTPTDGTLGTISSLGENRGVISLTDANIQLEDNGACDVTVSSFNIYKVI